MPVRPPMRVCKARAGARAARLVRFRGWRFRQHARDTRPVCDLLRRRRREGYFTLGGGSAGGVLAASFAAVPGLLPRLARALRALRSKANRGGLRPHTGYRLALSFPEPQAIPAERSDNGASRSITTQPPWMNLPIALMRLRGGMIRQARRCGIDFLRGA